MHHPCMTSCKKPFARRRSRCVRERSLARMAPAPFAVWSFRRISRDCASFSGGAAMRPRLTRVIDVPLLSYCVARLLYYCAAPLLSYYAVPLLSYCVALKVFVCDGLDPTHDARMSAI